MINGIFFRFLLKVILFALIALILYGVVPDLALILILFVVWRFSSLVVEAFRKSIQALFLNFCFDWFSYFPIDSID